VVAANGRAVFVVAILLAIAPLCSGGQLSFGICLIPTTNEPINSHASAAAAGS
jgi:hypothetical protein